jgi:hypothetical protein
MLYSRLCVGVRERALHSQVFVERLVLPDERVDKLELALAESQVQTQKHKHTHTHTHTHKRTGIKEIGEGVSWVGSRVRVWVCGCE